MSAPTYIPKEALVLDFKDFICRCPTRTDGFKSAIDSAIENCPDEMGQNKVEHLDTYLSFCDGLLRWVPSVDSLGDELLRKYLVFHWVFDQPTVLHFQTPISPENSNSDLSWLSYWLVCFARQQGKIPRHARVGRSGLDVLLEPKLVEMMKVIVMPADPGYDGNWYINERRVNLNLRVKIVHHKRPIKDLLRISESDKTWDEGHFTHSFLGPSDYPKTKVLVREQIASSE
ncbi:uncharacterized protein N7503_004144 [Penicillium pulvis]|uniref:uncharacterized protein n=1 Tax=Penicillium pulvis TaxID=1562058 RepID=UPI0025486CD9|nr:uncharacterized protein N7503_004144 [Penicillium pulvis]KAJ5806542.1 hypothetical protein N7503_004144 [Penicillium pulvis]